jgi:hypothetical protein
VTSGRVESPLRVLLYGTEGVGKSTFAMGAPNPVYLCAEDGTEHLDIHRLPAPRTWTDVRESIRDLTTEPHDFRALVLDTVDWIEPMLWEHICQKNGKASIEAFGFGKGYVAALDEWRLFVADLERLRKDRKMWIVLLAHAVIRTFKNPEGEDYDRWQLKIHDKASGLLKEWSDCVLFANFETCTFEDSKAKTKAISSGARFVHTQRRAAWDAKNRYDLPERLPLSWADFAAALNARRPSDPAKLREEIAALVAQVKDEAISKWVADALTKAANDAASLARIKDRLAAKAAQVEA